MTFSILIPAIVCLLLALFIILFVFRTFALAIVGSPFSWLEQSRLKRKELLMKKGDQFNDEGSCDLATNTWRGAFYLDRINHCGSLIESVHNHNIAVLGRLVSQAEARGSHLSGLPLVEGLLASRSEMQRSLFEVKDALRKLRSRKKSGKGTLPGSAKSDWALIEFSKKATEIRSKIDSNRQALEKQIKELCGALHKIPKQEEITYH